MDNTSKTAADLQTTSPVKSVFGGMPKQRMRLTLWIVVTVLVLGIIIALITGLVAAVLKSPSQKVVLAGTACDTILVDRYNTAMTGYYGDDRTSGLKTLSTLSDEIGKRAGAEHDATCLFIRYRAALLNNQYAAAKDNFDKLSTQVNAGNSVDTRLDGVSSLASMQRDLTTIDPDVKDPDD